jgi:hypothetical protein
VSNTFWGRSKLYCTHFVADKNEVHEAKAKPQFLKHRGFFFLSFTIQREQFLIDCHKKGTSIRNWKYIRFTGFDEVISMRSVSLRI